MAHPKSKYERRELGKNKGKRRTSGYLNNFPLPESWPAEKKKKWLEKHQGLLRDTTKVCSCVACGNPRRKLKEKTIQELREDEKNGVVAQSEEQFPCTE